MPFKDPKVAKEKNREYQRKWYQNNSKTQQRRVQERQRRNRQWLYEYKKRECCEKCKISHPAVLDFHHKPGEDKKFSLGDAIRLGFSLTKIKDEIAKCEIVCANCHRMIHWESGTGSFRYRSKT